MFVLIGCGSAKRAEPAAARDLYTGSLFRYRRRYAERFGKDGWMIISAKYGLVHPDTVIEPYDLHVKQLTRSKQEAWAKQVGEQFSLVRAWLPNQRFAGERCRSLELHLGWTYIELLWPWLRDWHAPMAHMGIGEQLHWYKETLTKAAA